MSDGCVQITDAKFMLFVNKDDEHWLLAFENGVFDLESEEMFEHRRPK